MKAKRENLEDRLAKNRIEYARKKAATKEALERERALQEA